MIKKYMCSLLLFCLVLGYSATGWAAASVTEQELRMLLQNSTRRQEISEILLTNSTEAQRLLLKSIEEIKLLKQDLAESKALVKKLSEELQAAILLSKNQEDLIARTNVLFENYSKEMKKTQARLKTERTLWMIVAGVAGYFAVTK